MIKWNRLFGRPMRFDGFAFHDRVANRDVNYYLDDEDVRWMAFTAWSFFRVKANPARTDRAGAATSGS